MSQILSVLRFLTQNRQFAYFSIIVTAALVIFLISWLVEPRHLFNGWLFTLFLFLFAVWLTLLIYASHEKVLFIVFLFFVALVLLALFLLIAFSWLFCLWNAYFVWQYESHTLPNLLTLILGIALIFVWVLTLLGPDRYLPDWLNDLLLAAPFIGLYLALIMYNFLINLLLYQFVPRHYDQDYLIILGAGLFNGEKVTPLLANRINRALWFAQKQVSKGRKMPKIIMAGGQGPDEKIPEAQAMKTYALAHGIPAKDILLEDQSRNTYQNMIFAKAVARRDFGSSHFKAKFFTNNYHLLRAGLYAKKANLAANGVGCYTRPYFLPNAIIREFAGVFVMHKERHLIIIGLIVLLCLVRTILAALGIQE